MPPAHRNLCRRSRLRAAYSRRSRPLCRRHNQQCQPSFITIARRRTQKCGRNSRNFKCCHRIARRHRIRIARNPRFRPHSRRRRSTCRSRPRRPRTGCRSRDSGHIRPADSRRPLYGGQHIGRRRNASERAPCPFRPRCLSKVQSRHGATTPTQRYVPELCEAWPPNLNITGYRHRPEAPSYLPVATPKPSANLSDSTI